MYIRYISFTVYYIYYLSILSTHYYYLLPLHLSAPWLGVDEHQQGLGPGLGGDLEGAGAEVGGGAVTRHHGALPAQHEVTWPCLHQSQLTCPAPWGRWRWAAAGGRGAGPGRTPPAPGSHTGCGAAADTCRHVVTRHTRVLLPWCGTTDTGDPSARCSSWWSCDTCHTSPPRYPPPGHVTVDRATCHSRWSHVSRVVSLLTQWWVIFWLVFMVLT